MSNIQIKRGTQALVDIYHGNPVDGEPVFATDTNTLYIGGNQIGGSSGGAGLAPYVKASNVSMVGGAPNQVIIAGGNFDNNTTVTGTVGTVVTNVVVEQDHVIKCTVTPDAGFTTSELVVKNGELNSYGGVFTINKVVPDNSFRMRVNMSLIADHTFTLGLVSGFNYNFTVDWGDGTSDVITSYNQAERVHTYSSGTFFEISITGTMEAYRQTVDKYVTHLLNLGHTGLIDGIQLFYGVTTLTYFNSGDCDTSLVTSLRNFLSGCSGLTSVDVSTMDVGLVEDFSYAFNGVPGYINCGSWNTGSAGDMSYMFVNTSGGAEYHNFNTINVLNMEYIFSGAAIIDSHLDMSAWDMSNVQYLNSAFNNATCTQISLGFWAGVPSLINMYRTFSYLDNVITIDVSMMETSSVTIMTELFFGCTVLTNVILGGKFSTSACTKFDGFYSLCKSLTDLQEIYFDTSVATTMDRFANGCISLVTVDAGQLVNSQATTISSMFEACSLLESIDVSNWTPSSVANIISIFKNCKSLKAVDFTGLFFPSVTSLSTMFEGCAAIESIIMDGFGSSPITTMNSTFRNCDVLPTVDLSTVNVSGLTAIASFAQTSPLLDIDVSHFNIKNISNLYFMMDGAGFSQTNYDKLLPLWAAQSPVNVGETVHFGTAKYSPSNQVHRDTLDFAPNDWTIIDGGVGAEEVPLPPFIFTLTTTTANEDVLLRFGAGTVDFHVKWGDALEDDVLGGTNFGHNYATAGAYSVEISGTLNALSTSGFCPPNHTSVEQIGSIGWTTFDRAFSSSDNLTSFTLGAGDVTGVTSLASMFNASKFLVTADFSGADLPNAGSMYRMFYLCESLSNLTMDTSCNMPNITTMRESFSSCDAMVNLNLTGITSSGITLLTGTFSGNALLETIDMSNVPSTDSLTNMDYTFNGCNNLNSLQLNLTTQNVVGMQDTLRLISGLVAGLDLASWDIGSVAYVNIFITAGWHPITDTQYSDTLIAWDALPSVNAIIWALGSLKYEARAVAARNSLIAKGLTLNDGGPV